ncbi:hypothetical protein [Mycolicibacterium iranicum]|uniref:Uncharacterized protein n=1 Tax=Mycolicibacterium iranicum TaxID=912594 RepID=A0ABT4HH61_MYCIR|nr:hypothetical protein [Mycolicibacterium iranicum]MCZ0729546.1 hypothetical protein [Mycolicibacterium iranicum]
MSAHTRKRYIAGALISATLAGSAMSVAVGTAEAQVPPGGPYT